MGIVLDRFHDTQLWRKRSRHIKKVFAQAFSLKRLAGSRDSVPCRRPQTAKYPIRRRSEKGEFQNSPVDCFERGKALARERFPYYERHLLPPPLAAEGIDLGNRAVKHFGGNYFNNLKKEISGFLSQLYIFVQLIPLFSLFIERLSYLFIYLSFLG